MNGARGRGKPASKPRTRRKQQASNTTRVPVDSDDDAKRADQRRATEEDRRYRTAEKERQRLVDEEQKKAIEAAEQERIAEEEAWANTIITWRNVLNTSEDPWRPKVEIRANGGCCFCEQSADRWIHVSPEFDLDAGCRQDQRAKLFLARACARCNKSTQVLRRLFRKDVPRGVIRCGGEKFVVLYQLVPVMLIE